MRRFETAYIRLVAAIVLPLAVFLFANANVTATSAPPYWGVQAETPIVKVADADYVAPSDTVRRCHNQDFVLKTARDDQYYLLYKDTTYTDCAFYTTFGLVSIEKILHLNNGLQPYHMYSPTGNIIATPNAHSLFIQDGPLFEAYDQPQQIFRVGEGDDSWAAHTAYKQDYRLRDGVLPRTLKDSRGNTIQYVTHTKISQNGDWLIMEKATQLIRVRADDFTDLLTFPGNQPFLGQTPNDDLAISNDGRYAAMAANDHLSFKLYDLSACTPDTTYNLSNASNCQARDMIPLLIQALNDTVDHIDEPQFSPDGGSLTIRVAVGTGSGKHTELVELTAPGAVAAESQRQSTNYIALGDSYASGEGAFAYYSGTDEAANKCHLSRYSYPYLLGLSLQLDSAHSVACSGAKMVNVDGYGTAAAQHELRPADAFSAYWLPGYSPQLQYVQDQHPDIVTVSMVGNDVGFSDIIERCVSFDTCFSTYEDRAGLVLNIDSKFNSLVAMYAEIKAASAAHARVYVIGYPNIVTPGGNCAINVHLNAGETEFAAELVDYLDSVIQLAAAKAGVGYVDTSDTFGGFRLCDSGDLKAVNGLTAGNDALGVIGQESYHPTAFGHQLLALTIADQTRNFTVANPEPNWGIVEPDGGDAAAFTGDAPANGQPIREIEFDDEAPTVVQSSEVQGYLASDQYHLSSNSSYQVWIHSTPMQLGTFTTDPDGNMSYAVTLPGNLEPGWHTIDVYGDDITGQAVDIQRMVYVPVSTQDWKGDGVVNSNEPCGLFGASGVDKDQDGIDDSCDPVIGPAPTNTSVPPSTSSSSGNSSTSYGGGNELTASSGVRLQPGNAPAFVEGSSINTGDGNVLGAHSNYGASKSIQSHASQRNSDSHRAKWWITAAAPFILLVAIAWTLRRSRA